MDLNNREYVKKLPDAFKKSVDSNNNKLLSINSAALKKFYEDVDEVLAKLDLNNAAGEVLNMYGEMLSVPRGTLNDKQYKAYIRARIAANLSQGDYYSVLKGLGIIFNAEAGALKITENLDKAAVKLATLPYKMLLETGLKTAQVKELMKDLLPVGVQIEDTNFEGTFEFGGVPHVKSTASGTSLMLTDATDSPIESVDVYGKSTQGYASHGGTPLGKNLFDSPLVYGTYAEEGVIVDVNNAVRTTKRIYLEAGTYTISSQNAKRGVGYKFTDATITTGTQIFPWTNESNIPKTFTLTENAYCVFAFNNVPVTGDIVLENVTDLQIEKGSTATTYEPYKGTPNPDCPVDIVSVGDDGDVGIAACRKNLFNIATATKQYVSSAGTNENDPNYLLSEFIPCQNATHITVSGIVGSGTVWYRIAKYDKNKTFIIRLVEANVQTGAYTFDVSDCSFFRLSYEHALEANAVATDVQVEYGSTATAYEPYKGNTATITSGLPLCSVGNVRDELVYNADGTGKIIKNTGFVLLNGSDDENWQIMYDVFFWGGSADSLLSPPAISSIGIKGYWEIGNGSYGLALAYGVRLNLANMNAQNNTVDELKTYLASNPIKVVYQLETPREIELSAAEMAELAALQTLEGVTNVFNDENAYMTLGYKTNSSGELEYDPEKGFGNIEQTIGGYFGSMISSYEPPPSRVDKPSIEAIPDGEHSYNDTVTISITTLTDGATIHYTTDGSDPTNEKAIYTDTFTLTNSDKFGAEKTVKAIGILPPLENSFIASRTIVWKEKVLDHPTVTAVAGDKQAVLSWNSVDSDAKYYVCRYSNGTYTQIAELTGTSYTATGLVNDVTYQFVVVASLTEPNYLDYGESDVVSVTPFEMPTVVRPIITTTPIDTSSLAYNETVTATIECETAGATIRYTTDGTTPTVTSDVYTKALELTSDNKYGGTIELKAFATATNYQNSSIATKRIVRNAKKLEHPVVSASVANQEITLSWASVEEDAKYYVYSYNAGTYTLLSTQTELTYTATGLTNGEEYSYVVVASLVEADTSGYTEADVVTATPMDVVKWDGVLTTGSANVSTGAPTTSTTYVRSADYITGLHENVPFRFNCDVGTEQYDYTGDVRLFFYDEAGAYLSYIKCSSLTTGYYITVTPPAGAAKMMFSHYGVTAARATAMLADNKYSVSVLGGNDIVWDRQLEEGYIDESTGKNVAATGSSKYRTVNFLENIQENTSYTVNVDYCYDTATTAKTLTVFYYKADGTYISSESLGDMKTGSTATLTTPSGTAKMKFQQDCGANTATGNYYGFYGVRSNLVNFTKS